MDLLRDGKPSRNFILAFIKYGVGSVERFGEVGDCLGLGIAWRVGKFGEVLVERIDWAINFNDTFFIYKTDMIFLYIMYQPALDHTFISSIDNISPYNYHF